MQLHTLSSNQRAVRHRVGRGGKRGSYSGRGIKGQHSRSGRRIRPAFRDLLIRIPKRKGFGNKADTNVVLAINLSDLGKLRVKAAQGKALVSPGVLREMDIIPRRFRGVVKVLAGGAIDFPVRVVGLSVSAVAKTKIEKAGGEIASPKEAKS